MTLEKSVIQKNDPCPWCVSFWGPEKGWEAVALDAYHLNNLRTDQTKLQKPE